MFGKKPETKGAAPAAKSEAKAPAPPAKTETKPAESPKAEKKGLFGFGKKKTTAAAAKPTEGAAHAAASKPTSAPESPAKTKKKGGSPIMPILLLLVVLAFGGGVYYVYTNFLGASGAPAKQADAPALPTAAVKPLSNAQTSLNEGDSASSAKPVKKKAKSCGGTPKFLSRLKLSPAATFSTSEPDTRGLVLLSPVENSDAVSKYQHQSWNQAGFLDAFVIDQNGNLYVAPTPRTGLGVAKPKNQDHIYKLDTNSGELKDMLALPSAAPSSPQNPYGVLGLALDCDSNSLYVTTVTGSTDASEVGRIYRLDLSSGEVAGQVENTDGYGAAVRTTATGKQLVFGSARDGKLRAVDLDASGNFHGAPREIAALEGTKRARQISFPNDNGMLVEAVDFTFAKANTPRGSNVNFTYDAASDKWSVTH